MSLSPLTRRSFLSNVAALMAVPALAGADELVPTTRQQKRLTDEELIDLVQRQTMGYFWDFAHPGSGLVREGSAHPQNLCAIGGTGFGIMALLVAVDRKWLTRKKVAGRIAKIIAFLAKADRFHGVFPHWLDGDTGRVAPFSTRDDGSDLVETSYLVQGLICARRYFDRDDALELQIRDGATQLCNDVDWAWHTQGGKDALYWHWSPTHGWATNLPISGWNECLITYVLAAASPAHAIEPNVYHAGWARSGAMKNGQAYHDIALPLGPAQGGPLFFAHYSFLGLDPRRLRDRYANYWEQNVAHTRINHAHCVSNPHKHKGYAPNCWGLTASVTHEGYSAQSPEHDIGVIAPTAALSSFPYTPKESMDALRHFYDDRGDALWRQYGFVDAFSDQHNWVASNYLAIDQGPIILMLENHRSGLLWKLFMSDPDAKRGLERLDLRSE